MKHKTETEEVKLMIMDCEAVEFVKQQIEGEEVARKAVIDRLSASWGKSAFVFSDFLRASGAFDENFLINAAGYDVLTLKPTGTISTRADGLPRLKNCGLSLRYKEWLKSVAKTFEFAVNTTIKCTDFQGKIQKVRFTRCLPGSYPELHFSIVAEKGEFERFRDENYAQMREYNDSIFEETPYRFYLRKWTNRESIGFFKYLIHAGGENVFQQLFRMNHRTISDFYVLEETAFKNYMESTDYAISSEIERLEKQADDYVSLMGDKYKKDAENGLLRVMHEISMETLEEIYMMLLQDANPGIVRETA